MPKSQRKFCLTSGIIFSLIGIFLVFLDIRTSESSTAALGILALPFIVPLFFVIGMGLGYITRFLIINYKTRTPMTTYQKNVLVVALIIFLPLCFFIYIQKSDDVVVRHIVSFLKMDDTWAEDWYIVAGKTRSYDEKIKRLTSAIKFKQDFSEAYRARANYQPSYEKAIEDYNKAIKYKPHFYYNIELDDGYYIDLYIKRGIVKESLKDFNGAIEDYSEAIKLNPTDSVSESRQIEAYNLRGDLKSKLGDKRVK